MIFGWMIYGEIIIQVVLSSFPIHYIVPLSSPLTYPIEYHLNSSGFLLLEVVVHKYVYGCVVCDYWCLRFLVSHSFEGSYQGIPLLAVNN